MKGIIDIKSKEYPPLLKEIKQAPKKIYYKGNWNTVIFEKCLAVVGSRRMTTYGKHITENLVSEIAGSGITIASGFMYGIDATAHKAALDIGGKTIAVMPCGIDRIHPEYQGNLYNEILENKGLIISEYLGSSHPQNWTYPQRNRIMAGLSQAILVVEAAQKSGSLITAKLAKKYNRKIFSVPGPLNSATSKGTANLIKEGASIVTSAEDILQYYGIENIKITSKNSPLSDLSKLEQSITKELKAEPLEIDELSRLIKTPISKLSAAVSLMQIKGLLTEEKRKYYIKENPCL